MKPRVVVISGRVGAGKSTLANKLRDHANAELIKSKELIQSLLPRTGRHRRAWQVAGQKLDKTTGGRWLADALNERVMRGGAVPLVAVDAVRIPSQIHFLRQSGWAVVHVHLEASDTTLSARYSQRSAVGELPSYADLSR